MIVVGALSQSVVERLLGASVAQPGRCFSTPESIRLVSGKARLPCPAGSRVQTPPEAPKNTWLEDVVIFGFFRRITHVARGLVAKTPYFLETISCLAWIPGETGRSGRNPCWDGSGKMATLPNEFRESCWGAPRIKIRADNGRVSVTGLPLPPLMPCKTAEQYPPFSRNDFLSGTDNRRVRLIRA